MEAPLKKNDWSPVDFLVPGWNMFTNLSTFWGALKCLRVGSVKHPVSGQSWPGNLRGRITTKSGVVKPLATFSAPKGDSKEQ